MADKNTKGLDEYSTIKYLEPEDSTFARTQGGFLSLNIKAGESYNRVNLHRAFPFTSMSELISVRDSEGNEIGMIRSLNDYPTDVARLLDEDMDRRYFAPVIHKINSIKEEFGYSYWDVVTDAGQCRFTVRGGSSSINFVTDVRMVIVDVDGNRFEIADYKLLDDKSYKRLEIYL